MRATRVVLLALLLAVIALAAALAQRSRFGREAFAPGDRVRLRAGSALAPNEPGTVTLPPLPVTGDERGWSGHVRRTPDGAVRFWVTLDRPLPRADAPPLRGLEVRGEELERQ